MAKLSGPSAEWGYQSTPNIFGLSDNSKPKMFGTTANRADSPAEVGLILPTGHFIRLEFSAVRVVVIGVCLEILIAPVLYLIAFSLVSVPSFLLWYLVSLWLPSWYALSPIGMSILCTVLAIISALVVNAGLESGALSGSLQVGIFALVWSALLIPVSVAVKYYGHVKARNS